jgi:hypothetical protein
MRAAVVRLALFGSLWGVSGCPKPPETTPDQISEKTAAYVTLKRDLRKCAAPKCGGYFITEVNRTHEAQYVSTLDLRESGIDEKIVEAAEPEALVLRARLGAEEKEHNTRTLVVLEAHRGPAGRVIAAGDIFYSIAARNPPITCATAPCNNLVATRLNQKDAPAEFTRAAIDGIDPACVAERIAKPGLIAAGHFTEGEQMPGGREKILAASQVYARLPEAEGVCPLEPKITRCMTVKCAAGTHCVEEGPEACVPNTTCAVILCAVNTKCVEENGEARCVPLEQKQQ